MGKMEGVSGLLNNSFEEIQTKIMEAAKARGADGVIMYNMEQRVVGTSTNSTTAWDKSVSNHRQWYASGAASTSAISQNISQNVLHADFIKYDN